MKIVKLTAENFMRLVAVEITPEGNTVLITGKNGQGKSSVLDAIVSVLCGKKYQPEKPIRDGEEHAEVVIETENWIIKRTFTASGGGAVTVTNADGMRGQSPQELLNKIVGQIAFDPMSFITMGKTEAGKKEQRATLMKLVGLDFGDIDEKIADKKTERSAIRTAKETYEHQANEIEVPEDTNDKEVSVTELAKQLQDANEHNATQKQSLGNISHLEDEIKSKTEGFHAWETKINELKEQVEQAELELEEKANTIRQHKMFLRKANESLQDSIDTDEITNSIEVADIMNGFIRQKKEKVSLQEKAEGKANEWREIGLEVKKLEAEKATRLAKVKMPIEGLSVDETGVIYFDKKVEAWIPLSQVNDARKLEVGMGIAMAENPELKVIIMKGNDLDEDSLKIVSKLAEGKDYQLWIERIEGKGGIVIEDGSVKQ